MDIYQQLRRDEGVKDRIYTDTEGKLTIGVGRNLTDDGVSEDEITHMLANDVGEVTAELNSKLPWFRNIDAVRQGAIINMAFNLGFTRLEGFPKFLAAMAQGNWEEASVEMLDSRWAKEVGARATRLAEQIRGGVWV